MTKPKAARKHVKSSGSRYVSDVQLADRYGVHRASIWRWAADGKLPTPVKITEGCTRWIADEIEARDAERESARDHRAV